VFDGGSLCCKTYVAASCSVFMRPGPLRFVYLIACKLVVINHLGSVGAVVGRFVGSRSG